MFKTGIGWISNWKYAGFVPTNPWRGIQSFPREFFLKQIRNETKLFSRPAKNSLEKIIIKSHFFERSYNANQINEAIKKSLDQGELLFIKATFLIGKNEGILGIKVRKSLLEETVISFNILNQLIIVDRRKSRLTNFTDDFSGYNELQMRSQSIFND